MSDGIGDVMAVCKRLIQGISRFIFALKYFALVYSVLAYLLFADLIFVYAAMAESPYFELTLKADSLALKERPDLNSKTIVLLDSISCQQSCGHIVDIQDGWYLAEFVLLNQKHERGFVQPNDVYVARKNIVPTETNLQKRQQADLLEQKLKSSKSYFKGGNEP